LYGEKRILRKISFDTEMRNGFFSMIISDQTKKTERERVKKKGKNSFSRRRNYNRARKVSALEDIFSFHKISPRNTQRHKGTMDLM